MLSLLPEITRSLQHGPYLVVPVWQVLILLLLCCAAVLLEYPRFIAVVTYGFFVHWVFVENTVFSLQALSMRTLAVVTVFVIAGFLAVSALVYHTVAGGHRP